jgi:hypothetical protein
MLCVYFSEKYCTMFTPRYDLICGDLVMMPALSHWQRAFWSAKRQGLHHHMNGHDLKFINECTSTLQGYLKAPCFWLPLKLTPSGLKSSTMQCTKPSRHYVRCSQCMVPEHYYLRTMVLRIHSLKHEHELRPITRLQMVCPVIATKAQSKVYCLAHVFESIPTHIDGICCFKKRATYEIQTYMS